MINKEASQISGERIKSLINVTGTLGDWQKIHVDTHMQKEKDIETETETKTERNL